MMTAVFSEDAKYRWCLQYELSNHKESLCAFMLNPSIAGSISHGIVRSDPTVTRMIERAKLYQYGRLFVLNLFGLISTSPAILKEHVNPVGTENDKYINSVLDANPDVVVAWGPKGKLLGRDSRCLQFIYQHNITPTCFGLTKDGFPKHPLYLPYDTGFIKYTGRYSQ